MRVVLDRRLRLPPAARMLDVDGEVVVYTAATAPEASRRALEQRGATVVGRKLEWPPWRPTPEMIARNPSAYARYADGMPGGPGNPLGARALYLYQNGFDTAIRIHGTTEPQSIGRAVSNGCIRMVNEHVIDLYARVPIGAPVITLVETITLFSGLSASHSPETSLFR